MNETRESKQLRELADLRAENKILKELFLEFDHFLQDDLTEFISARAQKIGRKYIKFREQLNKV